MERLGAARSGRRGKALEADIQGGRWYANRLMRRFSTIFVVWIWRPVTPSVFANKGLGRYYDSALGNHERGYGANRLSLRWFLTTSYVRHSPHEMNKSHFERVFEARHEMVQLYSDMLPNTNDVALAVLKGHLVIEELLYALAEEHCPNPEHLSKARLSFAQLNSVVQALVSVPVPQEAWQGIAELNGLRNALAHKLRPQDIEGRLERLYKLCLVGLEPLPPDYKKPAELAGLAAECIHSLMGALSVVGGVAEVLRRRSETP